MELTLDHLTKRYKDVTAVEDVNLRLHCGMWGLLGANGAGKTTLLRMVAGILNPSEGRVCLDGVDIRLLGEKYRDLFGYLPQDFGFYPEFTVLDYLHYVAALKGLRKQEAQQRIDELLHLVGLREQRRKKMRRLSGGMQRRVGIAQALLNNPSLLVLDEPTSGLDPGERVYFRKILSELSQDRIVIISTHIVSDIECIASQNILLKRGQLYATGTTEELLAQAQGIVWEHRILAEKVAEFGKQVQIVNVKNEADGMVRIRFLCESPRYEGAMAAEPRLEDLYLWVFREETEGREATVCGESVC